MLTRLTCLVGLRRGRWREQLTRAAGHTYADIGSTAEVDESSSAVITVDPLTGGETTDGDGALVIAGQGTPDAWTLTNYAGHDGDPAQSFGLTLTDENTTADVIALALANIPAFDGDFDNSLYANATLALTAGETAVTVRRFRYRWRIAPSAGCYMKLTWIERFTPVTGSVMDTPQEAEWEGTGTPCFPSDFTWQDLFISEASPTPGGNTNYWFVGDADDLLPPTTGPDYYEVDVPTTPGVTTIEELRWTCVRGEEPVRPIYVDGVEQEDVAPNILGTEPRLAWDENCTVDASPTTVVADGVAFTTVTATIYDRGDPDADPPVAPRLIPGKVVTLSSSRAGDVISGAFGEAARGMGNGLGAYTWTVTATAPGESIFTATVQSGESSALTDTATVTFS